MNYYNFFSEHTKAYTFRMWVLGFLKYATIFLVSFALSFFLIYNAKFNETEEIKALKNEIHQLKKENKKLSETVDSMNIQMDNVKKFYDEEKKAQSNIDKAEKASDSQSKDNSEED